MYTLSLAKALCPREIDRPRIKGQRLGVALIASAGFIVAGHTDAATIFTDADGADSFISTAGNWAGNALPTGANQGTIDITAEYDSTVTHNGYNILQTGGSVLRGNSFSSFKLGANTTWVMNGATAGITSTRGIVLGDNSSFTLIQGNANLTDNNRDTTVGNQSGAGGTSVTVNGGTMSIGRHMLLGNGDVEVNGGTLTVNQQLGARNFQQGGDIKLNGGTTTAQYLTYGTGALELNFGGTTAGTLTIENFGGQRHNTDRIGINFDPGSLMAMTLTNPVESGDFLLFNGNVDGEIGWSKQGSETGLPWAEALWGDGRLTYDGQDFNALGDWSSVLGSTFAFDEQTNTLSLFQSSTPPNAIPEPGAITLGVSLGGLLMLKRRRRV